MIEIIALYLGYAVMFLSFLIGIVFICTFLLVRVGDKLPHFIGYKSLMRMNDKHFEKWIETVRYMRDKTS